MELRSNRSRSKTPFLVRSSESFDKKEIIEKGNHVEKSFVKTTTIKMSQSIQKESLLSSNEFEIYETQPEKSTTRRSTRNKVVKTSDYSSEDGENEYNSSRTISQNERNQLIEDARAAANGSSGISALDLYRKSGRYWEVYPKTDWTYSQHSKDRVEIAPGVVAMPNMSRRTIHSINDSNITYSDNVSHKNINTDAVFLESQKYASKLESEANVRRRLFNNNREDVLYKKERYERMSVWQRFKRVVQTVLTSVLTVFYSVFGMNVWLFKYLYRLATWVMLMDTYLLCKSWPRNKGRALFLLCFIPMALLGGAQLYATFGSSLALPCHPNCEKIIGVYFSSTLDAIYDFFKIN